MPLDEDTTRYDAPTEYGYPDMPDPMDVAKEFAIQEQIDNEERQKP